jgi:hypothetical protein
VESLNCVQLVRHTDSISSKPRCGYTVCLFCAVSFCHILAMAGLQPPSDENTLAGGTMPTNSYGGLATKALDGVVAPVKGHWSTQTPCTQRRAVPASTHAYTVRTHRAFVPLPFTSSLRGRTWELRVSELGASLLLCGVPTRAGQPVVSCCMDVLFASFWRSRWCLLCCVYGNIHTASKRMLLR